MVELRRMLGAAILGLVQGLTEFLPVSSSGHLVVFAIVFGLHPPSLVLDVLLHVGTLLPIVTIYRREVGALLRVVAQPGRLLSSRGGQDDQAYLLVCLLVGSLPTAAIGFLCRDIFEALFSDLAAVGVALLVTSALLLSTLWARRGAGRAPRFAGGLTLGRSVVIGAAQGLAITPGISRSGATISAALLMGVDRQAAARYSFLLAVPAVAGAALLTLRNVAGGSLRAEAAVAGVVVAIASGYLALRWLIRIVRRGRLHWFAAYVATAGLFVLWMHRQVAQRILPT